MFTRKLAGAAAAAVLTALIPLGAAQAYVDPTIDVTVSDTTVVEGSTFTASASSNISCEGWTLSFDGTAEKGAGKTFSTGFKAPDVAKKTKFPLVGTCAYDDTKLSSAPAAANAATVVPAASRALSRTITITVLPEGKDGDGALPDTGGSNLPLLLIGGMLVVAGGGVTYAARRRGASA